MLFATTGTDERRVEQILTGPGADEHPAPRAPAARARQGGRGDPEARPLGASRHRRRRTTPIGSIAWGPGPRASQALMLAVRAKALIDGRLAPSVDDVIALAEPVLKHRMALTFAARAEGRDRERRDRAAGRSAGVSAEWRRAGLADNRRPGVSSVFALEGEAHALADRLPELLLDALRVANTVAHGIHGRRRAGTGRDLLAVPPVPGERPAPPSSTGAARPAPITLYVREREWEAAHTFWLWPDVSPSMAFRSHLAPITKRDRAAGADAGHRRAAGARGRAHRPDRADAADGQPQGHHRASPRRWPRTRATPPCRRACRRRRACRAFPAPCCSAISSIRRAPSPRASTSMAEGGVTGHLVQILDPAEETLAYEGRMEFRSPEGERALGRRPRRDPARRLPAASSPRIAPSIEEVDAPHRLVVPGASHRPARRRAAAHADHAAAGHGRRLPLEAGCRGRLGRHAMSFGPHRLPEPLAAGGPAGAAGDLVAAAHHPAAPAPPRRFRRPASWSASRTARRRRRKRPGG